MKQWNIPVTWEVCSTIIIKANTLEEAMEIAEDDSGGIPCTILYTNYVDGSWRLSEDDEEFVRGRYNNGQQDDVVMEDKTSI